MMNVNLKLAFDKKKKKLLRNSIILDLLGMASYFIPVFAEIGDLVFAPIYGFLIFYMYKKNTIPAILGGLLGVSEELMAFSDGIPTASIMWFYTYVINKKSTLQDYIDEHENTIDITEVNK